MQQRRNKNNRHALRRRPKGQSNQMTGNRSMLVGRTVRLLLKNTQGVVKIPLLRFSPDSFLVRLTYPDTTLTRTNTTFNFLSWRYRMNSVWDPDPGLGSGSVPGHSFYSSGYSAYRVLAIGYSVDLSNLEGSPVDVVIAPSLTDLGMNYASMNELFGNPYASQSLVSAKGGQDRTRLKGYIDLGQFWGNSNDLLGDANFGSPVGGNPAQTLYLNVGGVSASQFTVGNGLDYRFTMTFDTLYYQRKILIS
jgi:hypothetical protein